MKIEIDTKHDSPEEIRKVIKMLQHLVGENSYNNTPNIFDDSSSKPTETTNAFVSMFGNTSREQKEETMDEPKEEKEEIPEVIPY